MHVQFFPVYVLTCGAHDSRPSWRFDLIFDSFESHNSPLTKSDLYDEIRAAGVSRHRIFKAFLRS